MAGSGPSQPAEPTVNPQCWILHREPVYRPTQEIDRPPSLESSLFLFLPTLSFIPFILLAGRFAFPPCALGLCVKPALSRASFRCRCWLAVCFSPLLAPRLLFFFGVSFCCVGAHFSRSQSLQLPSASPALPIVCAEVARSFALHFLLFFFFIVALCLPILSFLHFQLAALDFAFLLNGTCNRSFLADPFWTSTPVPFACVVFSVPCLPNLPSRPLIYDKILGFNTLHDSIYLASATT